jgi:protein gp37
MSKAIIISLIEEAYEKLAWASCTCDPMEWADPENIPQVCKQYVGNGHAVNYRRGIPLPNVWLGVTCENQEQADKRIPHLLRCPVAVRFISVEPMLGPMDLDRHLWREMSLDEIPGSALNDGCCRGRALRHPSIDWVICGGESGPNARPMHPEWVRSLRDQCVSAGVPFFFKQWGDHYHPGIGNPKHGGCLIDGKEWKQFPEVKHGPGKA